MKEWLRQNPDQIPPGMDATANNAWSFRDGLRKQGWSVTETPTEVRLLPPWATAPEKRLTLYVDPSGRDGVESPSATRPIDILTVDEAGAFIILS
jgi:hypothetical protein